MLLQRIIKIGFIATFAILGTTACSDSNQDEPEVPEEISQVDELEYLQNNLVVLDDNGGIKERVYGRVLNESKPETVYVGVENLDEAKDIFASLFSDETTISDDGCDAMFTTRRGHAELSVGSGEEGLIATAAFDIDGLKYVNTIRFILNSAWPDNYDQTTYHVLGEQYQYCGWKYKRHGKHMGGGKDEIHTFVCIRESKNGVPALLMGISNQTYGIGDKLAFGELDLQTTGKQFDEICSILKNNWTFYKAAFNNSKDLLNDDEYYWVKTKGITLKSGNLHTGDLKKTKNIDTRRFVFYMLKDK